MLARVSTLGAAARRMMMGPTPIEKFNAAVHADSIKELMLVALEHSEITTEMIDAELARIAPENLNRALHVACNTLFINVNAANAAKANSLLMCFSDRGTNFSYRPSGLGNARQLHIDTLIRSQVSTLTAEQDRFLKAFAVLKKQQNTARIGSTLAHVATAAVRHPAPARPHYVAAAPVIAAPPAARAGAGTPTLTVAAITVSATPALSLDPMPSTDTEDALSRFMTTHGRGAVAATSFATPMASRILRDATTTTGNTPPSDPKPVR